MPPQILPQGLVDLGWMSLVVLFVACQPLPSEDTGSALAKINFDLSKLDENGLYGPPGGQRSLDYEFCIPAGEAYAQAVTAIDPSLSFYPHSSGRIGCTNVQVLTIGNTHQPNAQGILVELANLDYIERIEPVVWE